jgi:hypothetical protein
LGINGIKGEYNSSKRYLYIGVKKLKYLKASQSFIFSSLNEIKVLCILSLTIWIARFWNYTNFGLYADDYRRIGRSMRMNWLEISDAVAHFFLTPGQGRPLHDGFIFLFSFLGAKVGGLQGVYWVGFVILTTNAFLFYLFLKRLYTEQFFALTGALAFCLFPADTTQIWPTIFLGAQPSLTFLLMAFHCYLSEKKYLSYVFIFGCLLSYETVFPIFLAVPILKKTWNKKLIGECFKHTLILSVLFIGIVIIRKLSGESRISELSLLPTISQSIFHILKGPIISIKMFFYRPLNTLPLLNRDLLVILLVYFVSISLIFSRLKTSSSEDALLFTASIKSKLFNLETSKFFEQIAKLTLTGLVLLILAYPLTLIGSLMDTIDTGSRIHLAAVVGASTLCACVCSVILFVANTYQKKHWAIAALAGFFVLLIGYSSLVQQDYVKSWRYQQAFWTDVISLCPDLTDNTVILVEQNSLRNPKLMHAFKNSTSLYLMLRNDHIYKLPKSWKIRPKLYLLKPDWRKKIISNENLLQFNSSTVDRLDPKAYTMAESKNIILLEARNKRLTRRSKPLVIDNKTFSLKEKTVMNVPSFEKGYLYKYIIRSLDEKPIQYLK